KYRNVSSASAIEAALSSPSSTTSARAPRLHQRVGARCTKSSGETAASKIRCARGSDLVAAQGRDHVTAARKEAAAATRDLLKADLSRVCKASCELVELHASGTTGSP
ncbi:unnamed protein product, partial [Urochloa humidicola]